MISAFGVEHSDTIAKFSVGGALKPLRLGNAGAIPGAMQRGWQRGRAAKLDTSGFSKPEKVGAAAGNVVGSAYRSLRAGYKASPGAVVGTGVSAGGIGTAGVVGAKRKNQ